MRYININIDGAILRTWVYVARGLPTDIILGRDMMQGNVSLDFIKNRIEFREGFLDSEKLHGAEIISDINMFDALDIKLLGH